MNQYKSTSLAIALVLSLTLSACGQKQGNGPAAVKVNGAALPVAQLDFEVGQLGQLSEAQKKQATEKILKAMVDQQLLVQAANADKLNDDAEVKLRLEAARNQILADAYVAKLAKAIGKPAESEVADYFNKNPALFSERAIYQLQELQIQSTSGNVAEIKAKLDGDRDLNKFAAWLQSQSIPMRVRPFTKPAEQLAEGMLAKLKDLKPGQYIAVEQDQQLTLVILAGVEKRPVTLEQARDAIERFIVNRKKREHVDVALKTLREKAKIEYQSPYQAPAPALGTESAK